MTTNIEFCTSKPFFHNRLAAQWANAMPRTGHCAARWAVEWVMYCTPDVNNIQRIGYKYVITTIAMIIIHYSVHTMHVTTHCREPGKVLYSYKL